MIIAALPIGIGTVIIAKNVILLIYGSQYIAAVIVLQILIWSTVLIFARTPFEKLLESSNRQLVVTKVFFVGAIFNVILNLIVIPYYSYIGAAIVTVLTDINILCLLNVATKNMGFSLSKNTKISFFKVLTASLVMGLALSYLTDLNLFIEIIIGALIYIVTLILLKIFDSDELDMFKSIFIK
jgi:O-antigen/teichoic acid export membrane protein